MSDDKLSWLVLGANGQVGRELRRALQPLGHGVALTRAECDMSVPGEAARAVAERAPRIVVNAAAYTAVDRAEDEPALAERLNGEAVGELAAACAEQGSVLVHYSTDYVFDGAGVEPFRPGDAPGPLSVYGKTKLAGEQAIARSGASYLILRTSWVYASHGHNFVNTMLRLASERDRLTVVADQVGAPTWAATIADTTALVLHAWQSSGFDAKRAGIYHLCARGETSWHGLAEALFDEAVALGQLSAERRPVVEPIASHEYPQKAPRPANSRMDVSDLETAFELTLPHWREALICCLRSRLA
ncbi:MULTISPECIES: dTDP-4-dehydrorhamnose reductase [Halomonadaceae]|uniref:dTDP-4-dehydrorhamnose reductase n=1 Tax=Halomonadaceae TaxID=28256 RepID=UPI00159AAA12|nr:MULTISPECIES: dTDP-4-dehydrorhamnose reductase [Halomonas]QJQ96025.1 dTDP-4-dehydrorhamnose reductase [Halomonas sp. PA5]